MSAQAPERSRVEIARERCRSRTGRCVACRCEKFELKEVLDGYLTCECKHTQWGHVDPTSDEGIALKEKRRKESEAALAAEGEAS
jgi:hypothetical protein